MTPSGIVAEACRKGVDVIAICDHNSAENVQAVAEAARDAAVTVLGGMEVTSREEVHLLGMFDDPASLMALQETVYAHLPGENDPSIFGEQPILNARDETVGHSSRLLIGASDLTLANLIERIHELGGLAIASHVDRPSFSILSQLGFIPENSGLDAVEVHRRVPENLPKDLAIVRSSDAHRRKEIGSRSTRLRLGHATVRELGLALLSSGGRTLVSDG